MQRNVVSSMPNIAIKNSEHFLKPINRVGNIVVRSNFRFFIPQPITPYKHYY